MPALEGWGRRERERGREGGDTQRRIVAAVLRKLVGSRAVGLDRCSKLAGNLLQETTTPEFRGVRLVILVEKLLVSPSVECFDKVDWELDIRHEALVCGETVDYFAKVKEVRGAWCRTAHPKGSQHSVNNLRANETKTESSVS